MADSKDKLENGMIIATIGNGKAVLGVMNCTLNDMANCMIAIVKKLYEEGTPGINIVLAVASTIIKLDKENGGSKT